MKNYRVSVQIVSIGEPAEHAEIHVGNVPSESIQPLIVCASGLGESFVVAAKSKDKVLQEHERLVAQQNG